MKQKFLFGLVFILSVSFFSPAISIPKSGGIASNRCVRAKSPTSPVLHKMINSDPITQHHQLFMN